MRCVPRKFDKTASFVIQIFLFQVLFNVAAKTFWVTLEFINAHLQHQVAIFVNSLWGHSCAYYSAKLATSTVLADTFTIPSTSYSREYSVGFVVLGWILYSKFYVAIFYKPRPPGLSRHLKYEGYSVSLACMWKWLRTQLVTLSTK